MSSVKFSKNFSRIISITLIIGLLLCLTNCSHQEQASKGSLSKQKTETTIQLVAKPGHKIIKDCEGRSVEIPDRPLRVAALDSFAGEAMVMIGAGEKMVAAPNGVKMDSLLQKIYPNIQSVGVPMSGGTINAESLMNLKPDLILLKGAMYLNKGEVSKINKIGIPFLVINYTNMEEQVYALQIIGDAIGGEAQQKATSINDYYKGVIKMANKISQKIPKEKRYRVYHSINEITRTDGIDTIGYDWITCVGAIDVSAKENLLSEDSDYFASMEQIFAWDPDIVVCNEAGTVRYLMGEDKWAGLRAVREKRVYNIPVGATRWGQRGSLETFFAILWLGTTIYPEYYGDVDLKKEVLSFYKNYLGLNLDDETYNLILSGDGIRTKSFHSAQ